MAGHRAIALIVAVRVPVSSAVVLALIAILVSRLRPSAVAILVSIWVVVLRLRILVSGPVEIIPVPVRTWPLLADMWQGSVKSARVPPRYNQHGRSPVIYRPLGRLGRETPVIAVISVLSSVVVLPLLIWVPVVVIGLALVRILIFALVLGN